MKSYILILSISLFFTGCLQSGLQILPAIYSGDTNIYDSSLTSKIRKGVTKRDVERILGPTKNKVKALDKDHVNRYATKYTGRYTTIHEGEYELWKYNASKQISEMGIVGSTHRTFRKTCVVVFNLEDEVVLFECS